jgi:outer membrane protein TolC
MKDSMLVKNPLLQELELKYQSAQAAERAAFRQGLPRFGIGLDYVIVDERSDMNITDNGKDVLMPMISVSIPIFRGKYSSAKEEARLMQQNYRQQKKERRNALLTDFEMTRFELRRQEELISLYDQQIRESRHSLNLLFSAYGNSGKEFEEVLRMEQQLLNYQKMKATALSEFNITREKLHYMSSMWQQ